MSSFARIFRALILAFLIVSLESDGISARLEVFATFEDPSQVAAVHGSAGVKLEVSTRFPAWGANSLEVTIPSSGGRIEISKIPGDWRRQESLLLFIWSSQPARLTLVVKDSKGSSFTQAYTLRTGVNHLQLRLAQVKNLDLSRMRSLVLETTQGGTFYLDYFALDRFHPVIEERGRWDINYSLEVETPHTRWARPFIGGPIRTFAIADVPDGRGIVELAQRLELEFKATSIGRSPGINKWGFGDFYEHRSGGGEFWSDPYSLVHTYIADDLLNGPDYDVILWPGIHPWDSYPAEVRRRVQERVEKGAGLVIFYPHGSATAMDAISPLTFREPRERRGAEVDRSVWKATSDHYITRGVPLGAFPWGHIAVPDCSSSGDVLLATASGIPVLAVKTLGRGRVAAFGYTEKGMIPEVENVFEAGLHYPYQEYLWSLVARAVVWAAGREPKAAIRGLQPAREGVTVMLKDPPAGARLLATVRNEFGETLEELSAQVSRTASEIHLRPAGRIEGGRHFWDIRFTDGTLVHDWATLTVDVPAQVSIRSVMLETDRVVLGQPVIARLRLSSPEKKDCAALVRLYDNYDRLVDERRLEAAVQGEKELSVRLNSEGVLSHLAKVDCEVKVGGQRSDRRIADVFVLQPRNWDDYDIVMYRFGADPIPGIWPTIDRQLRRLNVTTLSSYSLSHSKHANYNIQAQTRISGQESPDGPRRAYYSSMKKKYAESRDKKTLVREYCLNDPGYRELIRTELRNRTAPWVPFSPLSYYVYEEPSLTCYEDDLDLCFSSFCMRAMRDWLKGEYQTLDALNRQWGTRFSAWDEVTPDDTYEAQARGNYASWADHRTFMEKSYAECFGFVLDELRMIDPQGILLNSGTQESGAHNGCDYSRLNLFTRHLNAYSGGNQLDFHRCFNPALKISGGAGYGVLGKDVLYNFYSNLFKGCNGGAYIFWQYSTLDPDLTMSQSGKDMEKGFQELRGEGIGKLVGLSTPDNNGIAIHYSYPSIHGAWIVDGRIEERVVYEPSSPTLQRFNANRDGWVKILRDSGLQFDFISYSDVERGGLISKGYRTFVLPMSVALSDREVEAIRTFVRQGGTVIADALPGIMDEHNTFRDPRALADVFGITPRRAGRQTMIAAQSEVNLQLQDARAFLSEQDRPILLYHRYGEGRAYLLNYFLDGYPEDRLEGRSGPTLEKLKRILAAAGISPTVRLTSLAGDAVTECATYSFTSGTTRLLGLVADKERPSGQDVRIRFNQRGALYDVRQKRFVGFGSSFKTRIEPAVPQLFAHLERRIDGLDLQSPPKARLGENVSIRFRVQGPQRFRSVAKVVVTNPAGKAIQVYGGNRDVVDGEGRIQFKTALNDVPGKWRARVTEVISGQTALAEITIQ